MWDLIGAILILACLSTLAQRLASQFSSTSTGAKLIAISTVILTLLYARFVHGELFLANWLPFTNAIVLGNLFPVFAAILAGVVGSMPAIPNWRKLCLMLMLLSAAWTTVLTCCAPQSFLSLNRYLNGVALQSTSVTCSACAAATLLNHKGISATEAEMSELCLTSGRGTNLLGIVRGLRLKTKDSPYLLRVRYANIKDLEQGLSFPLLVSMKQDAAKVEHPMVSMLLGPTHHCIVVFEITEEGKVLVGDPANSLFNPTEWSLEKFRRDWTGVAFSLEDNG